MASNSLIEEKRMGGYIMNDINALAKSTLGKMLLILLVVTMLVAIDTPHVEAVSTTVKIAHAAHGEKGTTGCKPGDQTGNEVCVRSWDYNSNSSSGLHWNAVLRCNDQKVAARIAKIAVKACNNPHIGYDKGSVKERQSFYKALVAANWDPSKIATDVETSCSPFVCACINAAYKRQYIKTDHSCTTLYKTLKSLPEFTCFTTSEYCKSDKYLKTGDILITTGKHTAIVVEQRAKNTDPPSNSAKATTNNAKKKTNSNSKSPFKVGTTYKLATNLRLRTGPGTNYSIRNYTSLTSKEKKSALKQSGKAVLKTGTKVKCIGTSGNWIKISSGWICGKENNSYYITKATSAMQSKKTVKIKAGYNYRLTKALCVRKGPGKKYKIKKRSSLSASAKKYAMSGTKAKFKKGTVVTCLQKKGDWMRVPSGWICCKAGNVTLAN